MDESNFMEDVLLLAAVLLIIAVVCFVGINTDAERVDSFRCYQNEIIISAQEFYINYGE